MISVSCRASAGGSVVPQGPGKWNLNLLVAGVGSMLNSATGTPLAETCGANMAAGYTTDEVPTCGQRDRSHRRSRTALTQNKATQPRGEGPSHNCMCPEYTVNTILKPGRSLQK